MQFVSVAVPTPAHSRIRGLLTYAYRGDIRLERGMLVRVPLGAREVLGIIWQTGLPAPEPALLERLRELGAVFDDLPALSPDWCRLIDFAARYYQRSTGELALAALPPQLRQLTPRQLSRRCQKLAQAQALREISDWPDLTDEQADVLAEIRRNPGPFLLYGVTGSGKTEVYMRAAHDVLQQKPDAQVLVLVPEINLTPQLQERFQARFGAGAVVSLHSGLTPARRLTAWLMAHTGRARIVLGTRVAVLSSMPALALVVVDEEHDASYKQQEGARYSARDLAIYRGHQLQIPVVLGSATPSLESWHASMPKAQGGAQRYQRLLMPLRVGASLQQPGLPQVRLLDLRQQARHTLLAEPLVAAIRARAERGEQSLLMLNRRGWAPVLSCPACGWKSACPNCSAYRVFHKIDRSLRCHHCGLSGPVPRACPECGNPDISSAGHGTEQLQEQLEQLLGQQQDGMGRALHVARMDADSVHGTAALQERLEQMHTGQVDVLVGTQMIAKGHDFRRVSLVVAVNPDAALFSSDFRAPERLFALLMQAAGRAGRDAHAGVRSEMWVQTHHPAHPLFAALKKHDYAGFASQQLQERQQAGLPPFAHLALLRADARSQEAAQHFLQHIAAQLSLQAAHDEALARSLEQVQLYPAVPLPVQRVARVERAQMLVESSHRKSLHHVLRSCSRLMHQLPRGLHKQPVLRWAIDVDPLEL